MRLNPDIKVLILDFDGVIVESVGIKDGAFRKIFEGYPQCLEEIMQYHLAHNATIRFEKFRYIAEKILKKEFTQELAGELSKRFSNLVIQKILECPLVAGVEEFLKKVYPQAPLYLASINPSEELDMILTKRNLKSYFKKVYAYPWKKTQAIQDILLEEKITADEAVFIGDSYEDFEAARDAKIKFVGRDSQKSFRGAQIPVLKDFIQIQETLARS